jgi:D-glycero-D-manno-heptose 1,7-bisphosphate phosphatase
MRKAIFLDRDGVINVDVDNLYKTEDIEVIDRVPEAIKKLKDRGLLLVVLSNQPVIARGLLTEEGAVEINNQINEIIYRKSGARLDAFYFCPHHPKATLEQYRKACDCRKPLPGMIFRARDELGIDLSGSYMIGDRLSDIYTGQAAGCKTILVLSGEHEAKPILSSVSADQIKSVKPDYTCKDLFEAAELIEKLEAERGIIKNKSE